MKDDRNYEVTNKTFEVLNNIKGFDVAISSPRNGKLVIKYKNTHFLMEINPIFNVEYEPTQDFHEVIKELSFIFSEE